VVTLGCAKNAADTDLLAGQLLREGMEIASDPAEADAVIVNTCAFLRASERESIDVILEMAELKRRSPKGRLIVVGCLAQRHGRELIDEIPEIDWVVGPGEVHGLAPRLRGWMDHHDDGEDRVRLGGMDAVEERWDIRVVSRSVRSAYVKISEGCDRTCSFCVIPQLRGPHRSRTRESILGEVEMLARSGVREVNLVAQELTAYGTDIYGRSSLGELLHDLDAVEGLVWIRLLYTYPSTWTRDLFSCLQELSRLCRYIDMPIQHVSPRILRLMRRPGAVQTQRLLERLRREVPGIAVRSTLITGFPGETEEEFEELLAWVRDYGFDHLGVFAFSPEEGTHAATLPGQLPATERRERRNRVMAAQREVSRARNRARVGQRVKLLIEGEHPRGGWIARHEGQAPEVDGKTHLRDSSGRPVGVGDFIEAEVTSAGVYDLVARPWTEEEVD
jgi:ribosomal protein S12 methylthiotransferase